MLNLPVFSNNLKKKRENTNYEEDKFLIQNNENSIKIYKELTSILENLESVKAENLIEIIKNISKYFKDYDLSFFNNNEIDSLLDLFFHILEPNIFPTIYDDAVNCIVLFTYQNFKIIAPETQEKIVDFLIKEFFVNKNNLCIVLECLGHLTYQSQDIYECIISKTITNGGFHKILHILIQSGLNEEKIYNFSVFILSISKYEFNSSYINLWEDYFECIDCIIQSKFLNSLGNIAHTIRNVIQNNEVIPESFFDHYIIENLMGHVEKLSGLFEQFFISHSFDIFNEYGSFTNIVDIIIYALLSIGLLRFKIPISLNLNLLLHLIELSSNDLCDSNFEKIFICSSWCLSVFCLFSKDEPLDIHLKSYIPILCQQYNKSSLENKLNLSFQIIIFCDTINSTDSFDLFFNECHNEITESIIDLLSTKSVFLLNKVIGVLYRTLSLSQVNFSNNVDQFRKSLTFIELITNELHNIQENDDYNEIETTEIPNKIDELLALCDKLLQ